MTTIYNILKVQIFIKAILHKHYDSLLLDAGYYMKFDTANKAEGHSALLESRILYPKRNQQCLEFFYRMSGDPGDQLIIWVRRDDGSGNVRKVSKVYTFTG